METLKGSIEPSILKPMELLRVSTHDKEIVSSLVNSGYAHEIRYELFILDLKEISLDHIWTKLFDNDDRRNIKYSMPKAVRSRNQPTYSILNSSRNSI
jgi:hypothetical protein